MKPLFYSCRRLWQIIAWSAWAIVKVDEAWSAIIDALDSLRRDMQGKDK